jgi:hypothetical protein
MFARLVFRCRRQNVTHGEAREKPCEQITDALDPLYLQTVEVTKLHKKLNKTALDLFDHDAVNKPLPPQTREDFSCSRIDALVDADLRDCLDEACARLKKKYHEQVYGPGWADS